MAFKSEMEFTPDLYPQFPSTLLGDSFPIATLETISLKKLQQDDETTEQHRLLEACKSQGFFYLDLTGCDAGQAIFRSAHQVAQIAETVFKLPEQEKLNYAYQAGDLFGYLSASSFDASKPGN
jgi:isopenicillin N synthase-like dioxygenase